MTPACVGWGFILLLAAALQEAVLPLKAFPWRFMVRGERTWGGRILAPELRVEAFRFLGSHHQPPSTHTR